MEALGDHEPTDVAMSISYLDSKRINTVIKMSKTLTYKCPSCGLALFRDNNSLTCDNKHCFDLAKSGYVNLHLVQNKKSKNPGDNDLMMRSRQQFLNKGYYSTLAESIFRELSIHASVSCNTILDIGCGEGYYLAAIQERFRKQGSTPINLAGIDIAKIGVRLAAQRKIELQVAVASAFDLPYFDGSIDFALSIFSPLCPEECARVLRPNGKLFFVGPGERHLHELAQHIYKQTKNHDGNFSDIENSSEFSCIKRLRLKDNKSIMAGDLMDLLTMTPYSWSATDDQKASLAKLTELTTTLDFDLRIYQKR